MLYYLKDLSILEICYLQVVLESIPRKYQEMTINFFYLFLGEPLFSISCS